jgi:hypothetical protein
LLGFFPISNRLARVKYTEDVFCASFYLVHLDVEACVLNENIVEVLNVLVKLLNGCAFSTVDMKVYKEEAV